MMIMVDNIWLLVETEAKDAGAGDEKAGDHSEAEVDQGWPKLD